MLSVKWGTDNEEEGIKAFKMATEMDVQAFWFTGSGILGALPDRLLGTTVVIEVKCPYGARGLTIEEAVRQTHIAPPVSTCFQGSQWSKNIPHSSYTHTRLSE